MIPGVVAWRRPSEEGGLGPELTTNGGFANGLTGWTATPSSGPGSWYVVGSGETAELSKVPTTGAGSYITSKTALTSNGKTFRFTFTITSNPGGGLVCPYGSSFGTFRSAVGTYTQDLLVTGTSGWEMGFFASAEFDGTIDNLSIREVL